MIQLENVSVHVENKTLIDNLSLSVHAGQKAVLFGASGAGKTTVLKTLIGFYRPTHGQIIIDGIPLGPHHVREIRHKIAYVPQSPSTFDSHRVIEYLLLPFGFRANRHLRPTSAQLKDILARFRLKPAILDSWITEVSGGEYHRLALIQALLLKRPILLLDEVTANLDTSNRNLVRDIVLSDTATTVLAATHDEDWIAASTQPIHLQARNLHP